LSSIADIVTDYQAAKKAYETAVFRARDFAGAPWTGHSLEIAASAVKAAANAVQTARLAAEARERLGHEMTEKLLEAACAAATFASEAARQACGLTVESAAAPESEGPGKIEQTAELETTPLLQR
jgi:hypothetical protein